MVLNIRDKANDIASVIDPLGVSEIKEARHIKRSPSRAIVLKAVIKIVDEAEIRSDDDAGIIDVDCKGLTAIRKIEFCVCAGTRCRRHRDGLEARRVTLAEVGKADDDAGIVDALRDGIGRSAESKPGLRRTEITVSYVVPTEIAN